jgi:organic hydroperoxide reductase OsmC/OhrA
MSEHTAHISWKHGNEAFTYKTYSRNHLWDFGDGHTLAASAAPAYLGDPSRVDPEQAFVAALASCHMLTFLAVAALEGIVVENYEDAAIGHLEKGESGKMEITRVELHPSITFAPDTEISGEHLRALHHKAHAECFLANSVKTKITTAI